MVTLLLIIGSAAVTIGLVSFHIGKKQVITNPSGFPMKSTSTKLQDLSHNICAKCGLVVARYKYDSFNRPICANCQTVKD